MAIKEKAKDEETKLKELEDWSIGVNLVNTSAAPGVVKYDSSKAKKDNSKRSTYENEEISGSDL
jgi:hypothetical protein